jgi:hypothetical protein
MANVLAEYRDSPDDRVRSFVIYEVLEYQYPSPLDRLRRWLRL